MFFLKFLGQLLWVALFLSLWFCLDYFLITHSAVTGYAIWHGEKGKIIIVKKKPLAAIGTIDSLGVISDITLVR